jgi:hypothetical protein
MKKIHLWILLLYPWVIGCSSTNTLRTQDESSVEVMGGSGLTVETEYVMETIPTCNTNGGTDIVKTAVGQFPSQFADAGIRLSHYDSNSGGVVEGGGGFVTTISKPPARVYPMPSTNITLLADYQQSPFAYIDFGKDYDNFGWRLGFFVAAYFHYDDPLYLPTFRLRYGRMDKIHFEIGMMRSPTYLSSGSIGDLGFGFRADYINTDLYFGIGVTRTNDVGELLMQTETYVSKNFSVKTSINYGIKNLTPSQTDPSFPPELGFGIGLKYQW